jgi:triosephosphate isomerase
LLSAFFDVILTSLKGLPMKKVYLNLKRFDIPVSYGGINNIASGEHWSKRIVFELEKLKGCEFTIFFPESSLISALQMASSVKIGCQGIHYDDVRQGGNFGAFTSFRTAKSMKALGVNEVLIAHSEDRKGLERLLSLGGGNYDSNLLYHEEIARAEEAGLDILYCVGEKEDEQIHKYEVIKHQLEVGLKGHDLSHVTIAYEPVWAIGPGKVPPDEAYIRDIVKLHQKHRQRPRGLWRGVEERKRPDAGGDPRARWRLNRLHPLRGSGLRFQPRRISRRSLPHTRKD